jgi:hypothetical protein
VLSRQANMQRSRALYNNDGSIRTHCGRMAWTWTETITPLPVPTDAPIARLEHTHTNPSPTSSHPSPQELPHSDRTLSPSSSATSQYAVYRPLCVKSHIGQCGSWIRIGAAPQPHFKQVTRFESVAPQYVLAAAQLPMKRSNTF